MKAFNRATLENLEELQRISGLTVHGNRDDVRALRRELERLQAAYSAAYGADPSLAQGFPREHETALSAIAAAERKLNIATAAGTHLLGRSTAANKALQTAKSFIAASKIKPSDEAEGVDYPRPNETIATVSGAVDSARAVIATWRASIKTAQSAPVTKSVAIQRMNDEADHIRVLLTQTNVDAFTSVNGTGQGMFLVPRQDEPPGAPLFSDAYLLNGALHAALHMDEAVAFYTRKIEEYYADEDADQGLTVAERSANIMEAETKIAAAEQLEEALIRLAAREFGLTIDRRPDAQGAVLLGPLIEVAEQPPAPPLVTANDRRRQPVPVTVLSPFVTATQQGG